MGKAFAGIGVAVRADRFRACRKAGTALSRNRRARHIENALFYHESVQQVRLETEMQMAADVQRQLLPRTWPRLAGLDCTPAHGRRPSSAAIF